MCNNEKSCITINCGCCGNKEQAVKYMQLEADEQSKVTVGNKIYFNSNSFGNFNLTPEGALILPPGVYMVCLNFQINHTPKNSYASLALRDLVSGNIMGYAASRILTSTVPGIPSSSSEGYSIIKINELAEICLSCTYMIGEPYLEDLYVSILQLSELPDQVVVN